MSRFLDWCRSLFYPHTELDAARGRVDRDTERLEYHANRIEKETAALERRVYQENHISAAVTALLRGGRQK